MVSTYSLVRGAVCDLLTIPPPFVPNPQMADVYEGEWADGQPHGTGSMEYKNGDRYEGQWLNGKRHGTGVIAYAEAGSFAQHCGCFRPRLAVSLPFCVCSGFAPSVRTEVVYTGEWFEGERTGTGSEEGKNPQPDCGTVDGLKSYHGQFKRGVKTGTGMAMYSNGDKYEGAWAGNVRSGHGTCRYGNGDVYEGQWADDQRHGTGKCQFANGEVYEGEWVRDRRHVATDR